MAPSAQPFAHLLQTAVTDPGIINRAYQQFHDFSMGNMLLAWDEKISDDDFSPAGKFPALPEIH